MFCLTVTPLVLILSDTLTLPRIMLTLTYNTVSRYPGYSP